eukprot:CAMPEP_0202871502 /NCGR_PEP_ID=MMETSP1391-20130828/18873_1 /ASSEMBLY_ACC=CAM_ASM_000867 /TAXON_ID=1034604 /ORGANISM="Chlamydomonas leiostraca, Strain SAG 11-49" /LENGTH=299 /DNA_ID=CAMNT_0049552329 /DNA_START=41 /DNA_END=940 /DNA_ORIENTATION=-
MTVEAQTEALASVPGVVVKNLFVKDKKNRLYIISAAPDTKVDLGVISARLGTGKGGVRFAPEEALGEVLQVAAGSVTPLAAANPEAAKVVVLLDSRLQGAGALFVHPLVNTASLQMSGAALGAAMQALGREAIWVDLELDPKIDRDNPPDLAKYTVAAEAKPAADAAAPAAASSSAPAKAAAPAAPAPSTSAPAAAKAAKGGKGGPAKAGAAAPAVSAYEVHQRLTDVEHTTAQLLDKVSAVLAGKAFSEAAAGLDPYAARRLTADLESALSAFKNAAFTMGYKAGKGEVVAMATKQFA